MGRTAPQYQYKAQWRGSDGEDVLGRGPESEYRFDRASSLVRDHYAGDYQGTLAILRSGESACFRVQNPSFRGGDTLRGV